MYLLTTRARYKINKVIFKKSFSSFKTFKSFLFCQKSWNLHLRKGLNFVFWRFFKLQSFQKPLLLSEEVFEFHEANGLQNQYSLLFLAFRASWLSKTVILSKDIFDENLNLQVFQSSQVFKIPYSFKRCLWASFSSYGRLTK